MSSSRRTVRALVVTWWPAAVMTAAIMLESTIWLGADQTSGPLRALYQALFGPVSDARWPFIHFCIRKGGHFTGYGLVGLSWLRGWRRSLPHRSFTSHAALALIAAAVIASADEFHQSFLPNRTSSPVDVLIDCTGALVMLLIAAAIHSLRKPRRPLAAAA